MTLSKHLYIVLSVLCMLLGLFVFMSTSDQVYIYPHFWQGEKTQHGFGMFLIFLGARLFLGVYDPTLREHGHSISTLKLLIGICMIAALAYTFYAVCNTLGV